LTVVRGQNLPKTDRLSKIDPYVVAFVNNLQFKTTAIEDNYNPAWNQAFPCTLVKDASTGKVSGAVHLQLYDENVLSDSLVGEVRIQLQDYTPQQLANLDLPIQFAKDKYSSQGKDSRLVISIATFVQTYRSLRGLLGQTPGLMVNDPEQRLYIPVPVPEFQGAVYLGMEYDSKGVDFKIFLTRPDLPLFVDMAMHGRPNTKVRRTTHPKGKAIVPGLIAYHETKLDDLPYTTDFNSVCVYIFDSTFLNATPTTQVVSAHGWRGALNFESASRVLHGVDIDPHEKEIFMTIERNESMLVVDWDKDDVDIKLAVIASAEANSKGFDLTIKGQECKKTSTLFMPPKPILGGRYHIARLYELDDVDFGTSFSAIEVRRYSIGNLRQFTLQQLSRIMG